MLNRKHDVVAVQITDKHELELPAMGRLTLEDAETGEILEVNTGQREQPAMRSPCASKSRSPTLAKQFRSSGIDSIQLRTNEAYGATLGKFFETRGETEGARMNTLYFTQKTPRRRDFACSRLCAFA